MNNTFIFDMDDTLIHTSWLFVRARRDLVNRIKERLGDKSPSPEEVLAFQTESEIEVLKRTGFKYDIFPNSFQKTFEWYALQAGLTLRQVKREAEEYYEVGMQVNNPVNWEPKLIANAEEILSFLRDNGNELYLVTAGDPNIQKRRVNFYGLNKWFGEKVYVAPKGKKPAIKEISRGRPKERIYFVGNSPSGDILPALESGINAIYIPKETWSFDSHPFENRNHPRKMTLNRLSDIIGIYSEKFAN